MASSIADIRSAVADALKAAFLTGKANAEQWQVSAYMLAQPALRSIDVAPNGVDYDKAMGGGLDLLHLKVRAMVPSTSDIGQQNLIDTMIDPGSANSMKRALENDRTLGGTVSDIHVISASEYKLYDVQGATPWLGIEWDVEVYP